MKPALRFIVIFLFYTQRCFETQLGQLVNDGKRVYVYASVLSRVQDKLPFIQPHGMELRSAALRPFFTPPTHSRNVLPLSSSGSSLQALLSPGLASSASSALYGTPAPPGTPPPGEERHIDHLLEEVMMGLNIMPSNSTQTLAANVLRGGGSCGAASGETLVLQQQQQQGEGEMNDILDHFLMSFEQHINNSGAREEADAQSSAEAAERAAHTRQQQDVAEPPVNDLQPRKTRRGARAERVEATSRRKTPRGRRRGRSRGRRRTRRTSSSENQGAHVGSPPPSGVKPARMFPDLDDRQLQQMPVVKLERRGPLPAQVTQQDPSSLNSKVTHTTIWKTKTQSPPPEAMLRYIQMIICLSHNREMCNIQSINFYLCRAKSQPQASRGSLQNQQHCGCKFGEKKSKRPHNGNSQSERGQM